MDDTLDLAGGSGDEEGGDGAGFHEGEGVDGGAFSGDGVWVVIHDVGCGEGQGVGALAAEHAAEIAVGDDAEEMFAGIFWSQARARRRW